MDNDSAFRIQIVNAGNGAVVQWAPGALVEVNIADELCNRLKNRNIGVFASQASVLAAVREEFAAMLWYLKSKV